MTSLSLVVHEMCQHQHVVICQRLKSIHHHSGLGRQLGRKTVPGKTLPVLQKSSFRYLANVCIPHSRYNMSITKQNITDYPFY